MINKVAYLEVGSWCGAGGGADLGGWMSEWVPVS